MVNMVNIVIVTGLYIDTDKNELLCMNLSSLVQTVIVGALLFLQNSNFEK